MHEDLTEALQEAGMDEKERQKFLSNKERHLAGVIMKAISKEKKISFYYVDEAEDESFVKMKKMESTEAVQKSVLSVFSLVWDIDVFRLIGLDERDGATKSFLLQDIQGEVDVLSEEAVAPPADFDYTEYVHAGAVSCLIKDPLQEGLFRGLYCGRRTFAESIS